MSMYGKLTDYIYLIKVKMNQSITLLRYVYEVVIEGAVHYFQPT